MHRLAPLELLPIELLTIIFEHSLNRIVVEVKDRLPYRHYVTGSSLLRTSRTLRQKCLNIRLASYSPTLFKLCDPVDNYAIAAFADDLGPTLLGSLRLLAYEISTMWHAGQELIIDCKRSVLLDFSRIDSPGEAEKGIVASQLCSLPHDFRGAEGMKRRLAEALCENAERSGGHFRLDREGLLKIWDVLEDRMTEQ